MNLRIIFLNNWVFYIFFQTLFKVPKIKTYRHIFIVYKCTVQIFCLRLGHRSITYHSDNNNKTIEMKSH